MSSWLLVVNPMSGRGAGRSHAEELRAHLTRAGSVEVVQTERRGHATELAADHAGRADRVVAVGGDGTLNEVLSGILAADLAPTERPLLGFLPTGTANVAGPAFGFPADPARGAEVLASAAGTPVDVGVASHAGGERAFLLWLGAGYDAVVIETLNQERTGLMGVTGLVRNAPRVWRALGRYPSPPIRVEGGSGTVVSGAAGVILANIGSVAFGGTVTPAADPSDGFLDCVSVPPVRRLELLRFAARIVQSSLDRYPPVRRARVQHVRLEGSGRVPFHLDGEPVGTLPVDVRLASGAVRLLRPETPGPDR